jgi:hypothetical protein
VSCASALAQSSLKARALNRRLRLSPNLKCRERAPRAGARAVPPVLAAAPVLAALSGAPAAAQGAHLAARHTPVQGPAVPRQPPRSARLNARPAVPPLAPGEFFLAPQQVSEVTALPVAVMVAQAKQLPSDATPPQALPKRNPLFTRGDKPAILYVGAEYCPTVPRSGGRW